MKQTTKRFLSIILSLVFITGAFVALFNFIQPAYKDVQGLKSEVQVREKFVSSQQNAVRKVQELISAYNGQSELRDVISLTLPRERDVAGALTQLAGLVQNDTLGAQSFTLQVASAQSDVPTSRQAGKNVDDVVSLTRPINTITLGVVFSGTYDNVKSFLEKLESNVRIFDVQSFDISPASTSGKQPAAAQGIFNVTMTLVTYYQEG